MYSVDEPVARFSRTLSRRSRQQQPGTSAAPHVRTLNLRQQRQTIFFLKQNSIQFFVGVRLVLQFLGVFFRFSDHSDDIHSTIVYFLTFISFISCTNIFVSFPSIHLFQLYDKIIQNILFISYTFIYVVYFIYFKFFIFFFHFDPIGLIVDAL